MTRREPGVGMTRVARRAALLNRARRLALFTIAYNLAEGAVAVTAGAIADSGALVSFGLDSGIESLSAGVLLWRLGAELREPERAERFERAAERAIGVTFFILAVYVAVDAIAALAGGDEPDASPIGVAVTALSLVVMPVLARRKRAVGDQLDSGAVRADAAQTMACVWLSAVVLLGLALNAALDWWWADPVAALGVVVLLLAEGREAISGRDED